MSMNFSKYFLAFTAGIHESWSKRSHLCRWCVESTEATSMCTRKTSRQSIHIQRKEIGSHTSDGFLRCTAKIEACWKWLQTGGNCHLMKIRISELNIKMNKAKNWRRNYIRHGLRWTFLWVCSVKGLWITYKIIERTCKYIAKSM